MDSEGGSRSRRARIFLRKSNRRLRRRLRRGLGYRLTRTLQTAIIAIYVLILVLAAYRGLLRALDWNTIVSIFVADIPIGLVLWYITDRNESGNRKILADANLIETPIHFTQLVVHYSDDFDTAVYPDKHYYIVNTLSRQAFYVTDEMQELIEARMIRRFPKHRDLAELNRYFEANRIDLVPGYPEGDDLFRENTDDNAGEKI